MNKVSDKLREKLAELEHQQWEQWSKAVAKDLEKIYGYLEISLYGNAQRLLKERIARWKNNWKPYSQLDEYIKDSDRKWADRVLEIIEKEVKKRWIK